MGSTRIAVRCLALAVALLACGAPTKPVDPDSSAISDSDDGDGPADDAANPDDGATADAAPGDAPSDASGSGSGGAPPCVTTGSGGTNDQCCVFDAPDPCAAGEFCYFFFNLHAGQEAGACEPPFRGSASPGLGQPCQPGNDTCAAGLNCTVNAQHTAMGTCRQLCDPSDLAHHGCGAGVTCQMVYRDTNPHIGTCGGP